MTGGPLSHLRQDAQWSDPRMVRLACLQVAMQMVEHISNPQPDRWALEKAKELEKYVWGGFAPIERAPSALSTIEEAAVATAQRLDELIANTPETPERINLRVARSHWERFISELKHALGDRFS